jgi:hypothetical protein
MFAEKLAYCPGSKRNAGQIFTNINGAHNHGGTWWMRGIYNLSTFSGQQPTGNSDSFPGDRLSAIFGGGRGQDGTRWYVPVGSGNSINYNPPMFQVNPPGLGQTTGHCDRGVASGMHSGGINVSLSDGSTRFIRQSVDPRIWWFLLTADGGEVINGDF